MAIASNTPTTINVNARSSTADALGTPYVCTAVADGTFADLRAVLLEDEIIKAGEKYVFLLPDGKIVGKSSEAHLKWSTALKDGEIEVVCTSRCITEEAPEQTTSVSPRLVRDITRRERLLLVRESKLGEGINILHNSGPQYTGHAVLATVEPSSIRVLDNDGITEDVIVSYSERSATYSRAGWVEHALDTSSSWVADIITAPSDDNKLLSARPCASPSAVWVTGRYLRGGCQLTLPGAHTLQPHPELLAAVEAALTEDSVEQQRDRLAGVWKRYGHVYVDSVEMGGMCHATAVVKPDKLKSKEVLELTMRHTLAKKFSRQNLSQTYMFDPERFTVVGGSTQEPDVDKWVASLSGVDAWAVTRTIRVVPVIELFDTNLRARILAATPAATALPQPLLSYPLLDTGVCATPYDSGRQVEMSTIHFVQQFPTVPRVLAGIHALDVRRDQMVRIKGNVPVVTTNRALLEVVSWDQTFPVTSQFSWLAIATAHEDVQCGTFETFDDQISNNVTSLKHTRQIVFERPYEAPPKVVVWFHHVAVDSADHNIHIKTTGHHVARDGFQLTLETWDLRLWSAGISWLAYSASRTDIASGRYTSWTDSVYQNPQKKTCGHVSFDGAHFSESPRSVFTALSALNVSKDHNTRLRPLKTSNVTQTGMDWQISTWNDSIMYFADASFVVF